MDLQQSRDSVQEDRGSLHEAISAFYAQIATISASLQEKEQLEQAFDLANFHYRMMVFILNGSDALSKQWNEALSRFPAERQQMISRAAVVMTYVVFCGLFCQNDKIAFLATVNEEIRNCKLAPTEDDLLLFLIAHLELLSDVPLPKGIEDDLGRGFRHISLVKQPPWIMDNEGLPINYLTKGAKTVSLLSRHLESDLEEAREIEKPLSILLIILFGGSLIPQ
jgi:hypothetical protein